MNTGCGIERVKKPEKNETKQNKKLSRKKQNKTKQKKRQTLGLESFHLLKMGEYQRMKAKLLKGQYKVIQ